GLIMEPEFIPAASRARKRAAHQAPPITADPVNSVAVRPSRWIESDNITDRLAEHPEVVTLMMKVERPDRDDFSMTVPAHCGPRVQAPPSAPGISLLETSRGDVHKASTLADYAASMGIHSNDVVAFGDQRNDAQMLRWAATS